MKTTLYTATAILFLTAAVLAGCQDSSQKLERAETSSVEATRDLEIAKSEIQAEIQLFRNENSGKLAENNRKIAEIRNEIGNHDVATRTFYETGINELDRKNRELERRLDNYDESLSVNWNNFQSNFNSDMDDLRSSLDNFFSDNNVPNQ